MREAVDCRLYLTKNNSIYGFIIKLKENVWRLVARLDLHICRYRYRYRYPIDCRRAA